jgi:hypothetical protein
MMNRRFIGPVNRALRFSHILAKMSFMPYLFRIATYIATSSRMGRAGGPAENIFTPIAVCAVRPKVLDRPGPHKTSRLWRISSVSLSERNDWTRPQALAIWLALVQAQADGEVG